MSHIVFENVWKEYGESIVLEQISFACESGSFLALVGPSGCGKTTMLKMLLGEERPTRGRILIDGVPLRAEPNADRGVVFQRYSVFPHLTVLGNVLVGLEFARARMTGWLFGRSREEALAQSKKLLASVGLSGHEDKYPAMLSGGMQQRLALAQALACKPRILLLDEPFGALDPGIRGDIHALMSELWETGHLTVVMVTHDLSEAFRLATRVIALDRLRNRPEERSRYGSVITQDIAVWPKAMANRERHRLSPIGSSASSAPN